MKTLDEAIQVAMFVKHTNGKPPDMREAVTQPNIQSIIGIIGDCLASDAVKHWTVGYTQRFLEDRETDEGLSLKDLYDLTAGAFANGVYVGILMEKQEDQ
jgi:hypothetical protein